MYVCIVMYVHYHISILRLNIRLRNTESLLWLAIVFDLVGNILKADLSTIIQIGRLPAKQRHSFIFHWRMDR